MIPNFLDWKSNAWFIRRELIHFRSLKAYLQHLFKSRFEEQFKTQAAQIVEPSSETGYKWNGKEWVLYFKGPVSDNIKVNYMGKKHDVVNGVTVVGGDVRKELKVYNRQERRAGNLSYCISM